MTVTGMSAAILYVLVFGASIDYALLIVARYREELRRHDRRHPAMAEALRRAGPAIMISALVLGACGCAASNPTRPASEPPTWSFAAHRVQLSPLDPERQAVELRTGLEELFGQDVFVGVRVTRSRLRGDPGFTQAAVDALCRNSDALTTLIGPGLRQRKGAGIPPALGIAAGRTGRVRPRGQPARPGREGRRPRPARRPSRADSAAALFRVAVRRSRRTRRKGAFMARHDTDQAPRPPAHAVTEPGQRLLTS